MRSDCREIRPELLHLAAPREAERNLRDLVRINRWFGGHRVVARLFRGLAGPGERFSVLDVGAASGDMGESLRGGFPNSIVASLDRHSPPLRAAPEPRLAADAFRLPFRDAAFDYVLCFMLLHHFADDDIVVLLRGFRRVAARGVVILDLERHPFAYHFLPATRWLLRWHRITLHDGPASVAAGFRPDELERLARAAGAPEVLVRLHRPWFRISAILRG